MYSMNAVFEGYAQREEQRLTSGNPLSEGVAWIDGDYVPLADAKVPLTDQGFLHSDLTYDVPGVWDGRFFRLDDHLDRFEASCEKLRLRNPVDRNQTRNILIEMVAKSGIRDAYVELILTRGLKFVREYKAASNSLYLFCQPWVWHCQSK